MASLQEEGKKITEQLGHGVVYKGPWLPYGPSGKFYGHLFEDAAVTRSSFVASTLEEAKEALTEMRKSFGAELPVFPDNPIGTCYEDAWRFLIKEEEGSLVHGSIQLSAEGPRINHAWVELPTGWIWEPQTRGYYTIEDFKIFKPIEEYRYTGEEAAIMLARVGKHGPWTEEEKEQFLKKGNPVEGRLEPWQMTQQDFVKVYLERFKSMLSKEAFARVTQEELQKEREEAIDYQKHTIKQALATGKLVPPGVIRDYPEFGEAIAKELNLRYDGIQEEIGMQFTDIHGTGTTFYATSMEDARKRLIEKRRLSREAEGSNPSRVRFDRASIDSAIAAAKRLESEKDLYIFATYLGYTIDRRPPPGVQQYVIVHPDGTTETVKPLGGNPVSMYRFVAELPEFRGTAWRAESGYWHDPGTTVADIIRFEQDELGNEYPDVSDELLKDLDRFSASDAVWVNRRRKDCLTYLSEGESEEAVGRVHLGEGAKIVSPDYCGGFLVLRGGAEPMLEKGGNPMGKLITRKEAISLLERLSMTPEEAARSLVADEAERREIMRTVQERVKREQNKWAPFDPREGPPLPRIFAGLRWPWRKQ